MIRINSLKLENINGGDNVIDGVCDIAGASSFGIGAGSALKWAGRAAFRSVMGGPVGWALIAVDLACVARSFYNNA